MSITKLSAIKLSVIKPGQRVVQAGFTLIEVLVSLGILAVGLLGMTAMQNEALKYNHAAFLESQALLLINDMVERIRANSESDTYAILYTEDEVALPPDCAVVICDSVQMTTWDVSQWRGMVENSNYLPGGESQITRNINDLREYTISIRYEWNRLGGVDQIEDVGGDLLYETREVSVTTRI